MSQTVSVCIVLFMAPTSSTQAVELLRVTEVAHELRVSRPTAYRIVASGALDPRVGVGLRKATRIRRDVLDAYIAERQITTKHATPSGDAA